ncbi:MAG: methyltransferase domain-containing protein [Nodularia sp. (in: Bacteria)]|nr:MAG: methyltransferase domain-containing protein [Nodularia sp. (in: cyanobacteria)]
MNMLVKQIHKSINLYCNERAFNLEKSKVLDIGCSSGDSVKKLLDCGIDVYGVDIGFKTGEHLDFLIGNGRLQLMELDKDSTYRLSFQDNYFDIVYTDQVVEHIQDINAFIFHKIC